MNDIFIGEIIDGYKISNAVGEGCIGKVYKAIHEDLLDTRAIKFIPMSKVKRVPNWQQEIRKVREGLIDNLNISSSVGKNSFIEKFKKYN